MLNPTFKQEEVRASIHFFKDSIPIALKKIAVHCSVADVGVTPVRLFLAQTTNDVEGNMMTMASHAACFHCVGKVRRTATAIVRR